MTERSAPRFLVLGASGYFGTRLYERLGTERAVATYHHRIVPGAARFDAEADDLDALLDAVGPITHAAVLFAQSNIEACAREPDRWRRLNIDATRQLIDRLVMRGIVPVFASTDCVFDGQRGNYREDDPAEPILTYGHHKRTIERYLEALGAPYIVVRFSKILSCRSDDGGMLAVWLDQIERGETIRCAADHHFSAIDINDAADALIALAGVGATGVFHVGGPEAWDRVSLFNVLLAEIRRYRAVNPDIQCCSIRDFTEFCEPRPLDISLCSARLTAVCGFRPESVRESCAAIAAQAYQ